MNYVVTLINDYELLAIGALAEADRLDRYREHPYTHLLEKERQLRLDALRFQEEADRLRGTDARRVRPSTVSAGLRR